MWGRVRPFAPPLWAPAFVDGGARASGQSPLHRFNNTLEYFLRSTIFTKSALAVSLASSLLVACGGGSEPLPVSGEVTNKVTPGTNSAVSAGQQLAVTSKATAYFQPISSHAWTLTQVSGAVAVAPPTVGDSTCASASTVAGVGTERGAGATPATSVCDTHVIVPLETPTSEWVVENTAKTGAGAASGRFILKVLGQASLKSGFGLSVSDLPTLGTVGQAIRLASNYSTSAGVAPDSAVTYTWAQVSGPAAAVSGAGAATMTFIPRLDGDYVFRVTATASFKGVVETRTATLVAVVGADTAGTPAFTLSAGGIQSAAVNTRVTLQGVVGGPVAAEAMSYSWSQVSGPATQLYGTDTLAPQFLPSETGDYVFELSATKNAATPSVRTSRALVTVIDTPVPQFFGISAGDAQTAGPPPAAIALKGTSTVQGIPDSAIGYKWTQISGPTVVISNATGLQASIIANTAGLYVFEMAATVGAMTKTATTSVLVNGLPVDVTPVPFFTVSAGDAKVVATPDPTAVTLAGNLMSQGVDASAVAYKWTQLSGPAVGISNATSLKASIVTNVAGLYEFELAATVGGATKTATTSVQVKALTAVPPAATVFAISAGDSQVVGPDATAVLLAGVLSIEGALPSSVSYKWTQTSGPAVTIANANSLKASAVIGNPGFYVFELSATVGNSTKTSTTSVMLATAPA